MGNQEKASASFGNMQLLSALYKWYLAEWVEPIVLPTIPSSLVSPYYTVFPLFGIFLQ